MVAKITRDYFRNGGRDYHVNHPTTGARVVDTAAGVPGVQP
jgi:hypothetical protein